MLLYKKGKFYIGCAAFALPDEVYLVGGTPGDQEEPCIELQNLDGTCNIIISGGVSPQSSAEYFCSADFDVYTNKSAICKCSCNGVAGYYMFYESRLEKYVEYRFAFPRSADGENQDILSILIYTEQKNDFSKLFMQPLVHTLLNSVEQAI